MGILDEIYEGTLDLSVPAEQLVLDQEVVELVPFLPEESDKESWEDLYYSDGTIISFMLQLLLKSKADDKFDFNQFIEALEDVDDVYLHSHSEIVGEMEKDPSFCFDPSDDALVDEITQLVSKFVWPPILKRFKLDRPEFIRQLLGKSGESPIDLQFSMIQFAPTDFSKPYSPGPAIYTVEFLGGVPPHWEQMTLNIRCKFITCHAYWSDHWRDLKVGKFVRRLVEDHGPAGLYDDDDDDDEEEE